MERHVELSAAVALSIRQQAELGLGGSVWDGALTLCFLLAHPSLRRLLPESSSWRGQRVCELGAGTGVCGLAAAALGADSVLLTDLHAHFTALCLRNVTANRAVLDQVTPPCVVECEQFEWGADVRSLLQSQAASASSTGSERAAGFDVLLASECVYDPTAFQPLLDTLDSLTQHTPHALLLMAYEKRKKRELSFWRRLFGFVEWSVLPAEWLDEQFRCADIAVLACKRRQERRPALSDDGSGDGMLGEFWSDYPNDARYVTKEAEVTAEAQHAP